MDDIIAALAALIADVSDTTSNHTSNHTSNMMQPLPWTTQIAHGLKRTPWYGQAIAMPVGFDFNGTNAQDTDFSVMTRTLFLRGSKEIPGRYALVMPDGNVSGIVTDRYTVVQPIYTRILAANIVLNTPGAYAEAILRNHNSVGYVVGLGSTDAGGDYYRTFAAIESPYDGRTSCSVTLYTLALICANGLVTVHSRRSIRIPHDSVVHGRLEESASFVSGAVAEAERYAERMRHLTYRYLSDSDILSALGLGAKAALDIATLPEDPAARIKAERQLGMFIRRAVTAYNGPQGRNGARHGTLYGVLQATYDAMEYTGRHSSGKLRRMLDGDLAGAQQRVETSLVEVYA